METKKLSEDFTKQLEKAREEKSKLVQRLQQVDGMIQQLNGALYAIECVNAPEQAEETKIEDAKVEEAEAAPDQETPVLEEAPAPEAAAEKKEEPEATK